MSCLGRSARLVALVALATWTLGAPARAETPEEWFKRGNAAYEQNDFAAAAEAYERVARYGIRDPLLEYNLGNAYYKLGRLGEAILHYERAHRLDPTDGEIAGNLELARSRRFDQVEPRESTALVRGLRRVQDGLGPDRQAMLLLALVWIGLGMLTWAGSRAGGWTPLLGWSLAAVVLLAVLVGLSWHVTYDRLVGRELVVVLQDTVEVLAGPGENNAALFTVHEGLTMELRAERPEWIQVSLPNGLNGWIPRASVGVV